VTFNIITRFYCMQTDNYIKKSFAICKSCVNLSNFTYNLSLMLDFNDTLSKSRSIATIAVKRYLRNKIQSLSTLLFRQWIEQNITEDREVSRKYQLILLQFYVLVNYHYYICKIGLYNVPVAPLLHHCSFDI
jgi:hypothetical protein